MSVESIDQQLARLTVALRSVRRNEYPKAHANSTNRSVSKVKTLTVRVVSRETGVKQKLIRRRFFVSRSNVRRSRSKIIAYQQGVSVASIARNPARGKKVRAASQSFSGAFYNSSPSGGVLAYRRKGLSRYPIEVVKVDIKESIDNHLPRLSKEVFAKDFPNILKRELIYRIEKNVGF